MIPARPPAINQRWGRMYLRVHRLSDAVSGALLGIGAAPVCLAVARLG